MKDVDLKNLGTLRLCGGGALVALATWGVWAFCGGGFSASNGWDSAFGGWEYGREDQKAASAALAAAGLDEWSWDDGRLLVPKNKKSEYQAALAEAGAYPKAPSESRRDAIREMGAFESDAKIRMRDLAACAFQLERTLERIGGIEYATVGVRARREQSGLTSKTVVTASIGVACREGNDLDANLLSAITVAAKHQLGVDANENISILDLRAGKSYFGSEKLVGNGNELTLAAEKERVETYWRDKLLKTFDYMGGVRVSVAAELAVVDPSDVVQTEIDDVFVDSNDLNGFNAERPVAAATTKQIAKRERATSAAERLAQVEIGNIGEAGEVGKPLPLATWNGDASRNARNGAPFARLGNPVATRTPATIEAQNLAQVGRKTSGNGVLSVGALERRDAPKRGVVPAGYRQDAEDAGDEQSEQTGQVAKENAIRGNEAVARLETVAQNKKSKESGKNSGKSENKDGGNDDGNAEKRNGAENERVRFRVRTLAVRVGTPRGYVRRVAQNLKAENAVETFATDETAATWSDYYRTTEQKIIAETKNIALLLLRPLAERNGWTENELTRSVSVDVFTDPNDFAERLSVGGRDGEKNPNGPFEVVSNFGQMADVAERVAEESTVVDATNDEGAETTDEASETETASDFWAVWKERALALDAKTKAGVGAGVGVLAMLTLAAGATAVRRRKKAGVGVDFEENEKKSKDAKQRVVREKEKKDGKREAQDAQKTQDKGNKKSARIAKETETRQDRGNDASEQKLRVARIEEKTSFAQNAGFGEDEEGTRDETAARNARAPQIRRFAETTQGGLETGDAWNGRGKSEKQKDFEDFSDGDYDDWDELDDDLLEIRSLIERAREGVAGETTETSETNRGGAPKNVGDSTRRREALDLVARNPERAAASLQRWLRPGA